MLQTVDHGLGQAVLGHLADLGSDELLKERVVEAAGGADRKTGSVVTVRELTSLDRDWKAETLAAGWDSVCVARLGELIDAGELPGLGAEQKGRRVGLATYAICGDGLEVVTVQALIRSQGIGRSLMDRLRDLATASGAPRIWLTTTNDNIRAFEFYQRWGMDLIRLVHNGVDRSRTVKPSIPATGSNGIDLRHELEFEFDFQPEHRAASPPGPLRLPPSSSSTARGSTPPTA